MLLLLTSEQQQFKFMLHNFSHFEYEIIWNNNFELFALDL